MGVCRHPHLGLRQQGTESLVGESVQEPGAGGRETGRGSPRSGAASVGGRLWKGRWGLSGRRAGQCWAPEASAWETGG